MIDSISMPHQRARFAEQEVRRKASFWPVVGVLGMRQVGKSTLLRDRLGIANYFTMDDDDTRSEAESSVRTFIARNEKAPTVLDEVQKVPKLFDAIKAQVDRNRKPGQWYISGSVAFSEKIGIHESLTGRIGLLQLYPMTLAELAGKSILKLGKSAFVQGSACRFSSRDVAAQMESGGLPVPAFLRSQETADQYWRNWVETTIMRDASKAFGRGFDPEKCGALIRQFSRVLEEGEYPSLSAVSGDKRVAKRYIQALENIFFLRRFTVHEFGVGTDHWMFGDSGLAFHLGKRARGEGMTLAIARHFVLNEIFALYEYHGRSLPKIYYKSQRGSLVDLVVEGIPVRIVHETVTPAKIGWHERALVGAMGKLKATRGLLVAPVDYIELPRKGVGIVPWSYWS